MDVRQLAVEGAWAFTPRVFADERGAFAESYIAATLGELIGRPFDVAQMNTSVSSPGVVRGIHFADVPPGQAKYVQCAAGAILDVVVDIRAGSPTFGSWDAVVLDDTSRRRIEQAVKEQVARLRAEDPVSVSPDFEARALAEALEGGALGALLRDEDVVEVTGAAGQSLSAVRRDGSFAEVSPTASDAALLYALRRHTAEGGLLGRRRGLFRRFAPRRHDDRRRDRAARFGDHVLDREASLGGRRLGVVRERDGARAWLR